MAAKALARGASGCAEGCVHYVAVKCVCLDAENGADDVRAMLDNGSVLRDRVDEIHRAAVDAAETSQRREVTVQQDLDEKLLNMRIGESENSHIAVDSINSLKSNRLI
jgi:hypothetical protein